MKKFSSFEIELKEFFVLGCFLFIGLFLLFCLKIDIPVGKFDMSSNQVVKPSKSQQTINQEMSNVSTTPQLTIVNDQNTRLLVNDDIVSYTTPSFAIKLPYDLPYYTDKYGANESSRQLLIAQKQLYDHIIQMGLLSDNRHIKSYNEMLELLDSLITIEDNIYAYLNTDKKPSKKLSRRKARINVEEIDPVSSKLIVNINKKEAIVFEGLKQKDLEPSYEAIVIIGTINEHMILLADRTRCDYYKKVMNKSFNYKDFNKPVIYNIIERIDRELQQ